MSDAAVVRKVVKEVPHAKLYSDGTIMVGPVRASYPHVFRAYKGKAKRSDGSESEPKFGIVGLMPKGPEYREAKGLIVKVVNDLMAENKCPKLPADKKFIRDGDLAGKDEYEGHFDIHASELRKPSVRDKVKDKRTGKPKILKAGEDEDRIYAGCWVNILIRPWYQNNDYGRRVNAGLVAVQFADDDEPFGDARISESAVDDSFDADDDDGNSGFDDSLGEDSDL